MPSSAALRSAALRRAATGTGATLVLTAAAVGAAAPAHADEQYVVRSGDTVSHIAARTGVTVARIAQANALANPSFIRAGQVLTIPTSTPVPAAVPAPAPAAMTYTVVRGDTLSAVATRFGTTVAALASTNGITDPSLIRIGQVLTVPGTVAAVPAATPAPAPAPATSTYTVVSGDTLDAIARRFGTTVTALASANGIANPSLIRIGRTLSVPAPAAATTALVGSTFAGRTYPAAVVGAANANKATLLAVGVPSKEQMRALVSSTATSMGVNPALALAVAFQESGFNHASVSPANAIGTMQVIPSSGDWASDLVGRDLNLLDPNDNVVAGVAILRTLVRTSPDLPTAIASYYQGASSVKRNGMYSDTKRYVANVQALMARFA
jgi:LysM repeat protein